MPYVEQYLRQCIEAGAEPTSPGTLNYCVTQLVDRYIQHEGLSYNTINDVIGVLEAAKLEFYRRVAAPYEDGKQRVNGDAYHYPAVSAVPAKRLCECDIPGLHEVPTACRFARSEVR